MNRIAVIGGGIVGCHIALLCAQKGNEVYLLERNEKTGQETSTRNSCVLHAGIYYKPGSLKAQLCVEGNALSREFFARHDVAFRDSGKFIIARDKHERDEIEGLLGTALENGVPGMERVTPERVASAAPWIECSGAIYSGTTGIIDTADYMSVMNGLLFQHNVNILTSCRVTGAGDSSLETERGTLEADIIINAAGLYCDDIARLWGITEYSIVPLKGDYYYTTKLDLGIPVYPVPNHHHKTLGIHLTPTFGRETILGPSEIPSSGKDNYQIETPKENFENALLAMISPETLAMLEMYEGFSGNRPRAYKNGERCDDFVFIKNPGNVIHCIGIESPGLTSAPAIARYVYSLI
ncbi:MAG TPA: NAD(P)/FAD-dependent oxidoreductase [Spirochaetota bacterium]|nr:NAD(P)/FAD-dependent oxidoreductase [Spirochaetota bacterium]